MSHNTGKNNPFYGKHHSEETKERMRQAHLGDKNPLWKGDEITSRSWLHQWVRRRLPQPELCEMCKKVPPYDLANITGIYNRDLHNWQYLCRHCHMLSDGRMKNLELGREKRWSIQYV